MYVHIYTHYMWICLVVSVLLLYYYYYYYSSSYYYDYHFQGRGAVRVHPELPARPNGEDRHRIILTTDTDTGYSHHYH